MAAFGPLPKAGADGQTARMTQQLRTQFAQNLKRARYKRGFTQKTMVIQANIDRRYYQRIESGQENPSFDKLMNIKAVLNVPWDELLPRVEPATLVDVAGILRYLGAKLASVAGKGSSSSRATSNAAPAAVPAGPKKNPAGRKEHPAARGMAIPARKNPTAKWNRSSTTRRWM